MENDLKMVEKSKIFDGLLQHKNPICETCGVHCFSIYQGGKKDKVEDVFRCAKCNTLYHLSENKRCEFTEEKL